MRHNQAAIRRAEAAYARMDTRDWAKARRERTRHLIELGGLVAKSGLEDVVAAHEPDTAAVILGALLDLADAIRQPPPDTTPASRISVWRERGRRALRVDEESA